MGCVLVSTRRCHAQQYGPRALILFSGDLSSVVGGNMVFFNKENQMPYLSKWTSLLLPNYAFSSDLDCGSYKLACEAKLSAFKTLPYPTYVSSRHLASSLRPLQPRIRLDLSRNHFAASTMSPQLRKWRHDFLPTRAPRKLHHPHWPRIGFPLRNTLVLPSPHGRHPTHPYLHE